MSEKKYRVHELVKYNYSETGEYIDENHTDRPLRNDIVVDLLNEQEETIQRLKTIREEQIQTILKQKRKIKALEKEVLDLRAEVGRLNNKKEVEIPHWFKYESSKGYTKKVNQDIRFDGDVE